MQYWRHFLKETNTTLSEIWYHDRETPFNVWVTEVPLTQYENVEQLYQSGEEGCYTCRLWTLSVFPSKAEERLFAHMHVKVSKGKDLSDENLILIVALHRLFGSGTLWLAELHLRQQQKYLDVVASPSRSCESCHSTKA